MNILPLFQVYENLISTLLKKNPFFYQIESLVKDVGEALTADILVEIIESIDVGFKKSSVRKEKYYVKETLPRTLITLQGEITFMMTYYQEKNKNEEGKRKCYSFITDYIGLPKWCKMTDSAEYKYIKKSIDTNMQYAAKNAIEGAITTRQTISRKVKKLHTEQELKIERSDTTPKILYIEMDEVHCNLQTVKDKIVPAAVVHEGHKEEFVKRKELLNPYYLASASLNYEQLWKHIYNYCNLKYDLDKIEYIFVSGDGASGIKGYDSVFANVIFVLDKFHYRQALTHIFKKDSQITKIADSYIRNKKIEDFEALVKAQIEKYPNQKKRMTEVKKYIINHIEAIINQNHPEYKCPCSMEGTISHKYARFITSRPFAFSKDGLTNKIQLLNIKANNINFDFDTYLKFKYKDNDSYYKSLKFDDFESEFTLRNTNTSKRTSYSSLQNLEKYYIDFHVNTPDPYFNERFLRYIDNNIKFI